MESGREELPQPEELPLDDYLKTTPFVIDDPITLIINNKHIVAMDVYAERLRWDIKTKIDEKTIKQIAEFVFLLNTNKKYDTTTPAGKPTRKKYTVKDVLEGLLRTSFFEDLKSCRAKFEERAEKKFDKPTQIEEIEVSSILEKISGFRNKTTFESKGKIYEVTTERVVNGAIEFIPQFSIYEILAGRGNRSKLLIAPNNYSLGKGLVSEYVGYLTKQEIVNFIKPLDFETLSFVAKKVGVQTARGEEPIAQKELKKNLVERHRATNCFLHAIPPVDITKIQSTVGLKELLMKAVNGGLERPLIIDKIYTATFGEVDSIKHNFHLMQYQPHGFIQTGTKVGKSSSAASIGTNHDKITVAGALGFSTAEKREKGAFDGQSKLQAVDEVLEYASEIEGGHFLNYLEKGEFKNTAGMQSECHGCHPFFIQSNPKNIQYDSTWAHINAENAALNFTTTMAKITDNFLATGSRLGLIIFRPDIQGVGGTPIPHDEQQKSQALWQFVQRYSSKKYTKVFKDKNVLGWLWKSYTEEQVEVLRELKNKAHTAELADFISGMEHNYKHLKGGGINLAFFDQIEDLMNDKPVDYDRLLADAKGHAAELFDMNVDSLKRMVSAFSEEVYKKYMDAYFDTISGKKKMLLELICLELYENPPNEEFFVIKIAEKVAFLAKKVQKKGEKQPKNELKKYENFRPWQVLEIFEKKWNWYFSVLERFGITVFYDDKKPKLRVDSRKKKYLIVKGEALFSGSVGTSGTSNQCVFLGKEEGKRTPKLPSVPNKKVVLKGIYTIYHTCFGCNSNPKEGCKFKGDDSHYYCKTCSQKLDMFLMEEKIE